MPTSDHLPPVELLVITPVYNEQTSIAVVIGEWIEQLDRLQMPYRIVAIDDGSKDQTASVLEALEFKFEGRLELLRQANSGHGQTILKGYRLAIDQAVPWVFQIDSDGQCDPQYFPDLWKARESYDITSGYRAKRDDGLGRVFVSTVLRAFVLVLFGTNCRDVNVPYRLMRVAAIAPLVARIPSTCSFTNVALSILAKRAGLRTKFFPIRFRARFGGETTVPYGKMGLKAIELYKNLRELLEK